jgi:hypothetical protein
MTDRSTTGVAARRQDPRACGRASTRTPGSDAPERRAAGTRRKAPAAASVSR